MDHTKEPNIMPIKYYLHDNKLAASYTHQKAVVISNGTRTMDDIIDEAMHRGTLVTRTDMVAVSHLLFEVMGDFTAEGYSVVTPFLNARPCVKGRFDNDKANFKNGEHKVKPILTPGVELRKKFEKVKMKRVHATNPEPSPLRLTDKKSRAHNELLTPGGTAILTGQRLSFKEEDETEGIFLTDASRATVRVSDVLNITPRECIFIVPETLTPGQYTLTVKSRLGKRTLKDGQLPHYLEVK